MPEKHSKDKKKIIDLWYRSGPGTGSTAPEKLLKFFHKNKECKIRGTTPPAFASLAGSFSKTVDRNILCLIQKDNRLHKVKNNIQSFTDRKVMAYPSDYLSRQVEVLKALTREESMVVVASLDSFFEKVVPPEEFKAEGLILRPTNSTYEKILKVLEKASYSREQIVAEPGDFSRRGEVIDFWPPGNDNPVRLVFEFDRLNEIKVFDVTTQRTLKTVEETEIIPVTAGGDSDSSTVAEYMDKNIPVFIFNEEILSKIKEKENNFSPVFIIKTEVQKPDMEFDIRPVRYSRQYDISPDEILRPLKKEGYDITLTAHTASELRILSEKVKQVLGFIPRSEISPLEKGFIVKDSEKAVVCITDIFPYHRRISSSRAVPKHPMEKVSGLNRGDYVVHKKFGVGLFSGLIKMKHDGITSDFLKLKYRGAGKLYVAVENADMVQKYVGSRFSTRLDSLSGNSWQKKVFRIRKSVKQLAKKLIKMYKKRQNKGFSFEPFSKMEKEFNRAFPHTLTPHQKDAVEDVIGDMESEQAMDRLVCGDVGFGKTEVSMRAAYRAVLNGKQVAFLAPTTVLARQHFHTFLDRFSNQPVIIEMLSRLVPKKRQRKIIKNVNRGKVDIVIGTHKLLSDALKFPSLGLVIIDEEQQFGVKQKEKLRFKSENVDILTTTATPIPRTLGMALGRVKGFSLINTPPPGRVGVKTMVMEMDMYTVQEALKKEVARGGQSFYIHSRVRSIKKVAGELKEKLPGLTIDYIHGRMSSGRIDGKMEKFVEGEIDCLVATTIVENGLDIPNANTMVIDRADELGLADIYQLRGRVGRSDIKGYCYLMYPEYKKLTPKVSKRLSVLSSFSNLGGGFQLSLKDLELRGAGELLGPRQHGNIMKVGFEYYSEILKEEVARMKGEDYVTPLEVDISLPLNAYIPEDYIDSARLRLSFYRRLAGTKEEETLKELTDELYDRFGSIPGPLRNLLKIIKLKILASKAGVSGISANKKQEVIFKLQSGEKIKTRLKKSDNFREIEDMLKNIDLLGDN